MFKGSSWYFLGFLCIGYLLVRNGWKILEYIGKWWKWFGHVWTCPSHPFARCLGQCLFLLATGRCSSCRSGTCSHREPAIATSSGWTRRFVRERECRMVVIGCVVSLILLCFPMFSSFSWVTRWTMSFNVIHKIISHVRTKIFPSHPKSCSRSSRVHQGSSYLILFLFSLISYFLIVFECFWVSVTDFEIGRNQ